MKRRPLLSFHLPEVKLRAGIVLLLLLLFCPPLPGQTAGTSFDPSSINSAGVITGITQTLNPVSFGTDPSPAVRGGLFDGQVVSLGNENEDALFSISEGTPAMAVGYHRPFGYNSPAMIPSFWIKIQGSWTRQDMIGGIGGSLSNVGSINPRGEVLGLFANGTSYWQLLQNGKAVDLDSRVGNGWSQVNAIDINTQGIIVGTVTYTDPNVPNAQPVSKNTLEIPYEFKAQDGMIEKGFDPFDPADRNRVEMDKQNPEHWTSVGRTGDLSTNHVVKIVFPSAEAAKMCQLKVTVGADAVDVNPKTFTAAETNLTITGKNPAVTGIIETKIEVVSKDKIAGAVPLRVMVMPVRNVRLGIYYVNDSTSPVANTLPANVPTADGIITRLNTIYRQACITFTKDPTSGAKDIPYDWKTRDGIMDGCDYNDPEAETVYMSLLFKGQINLAIAKHLTKPPRGTSVKPVGIWPGEGLTVLAWSEYFEEKDTTYESFFHVCAHEVGHALLLSDRIDQKNNQKHDQGPYPEDPKSSVLVYQDPIYLKRGALMQRDINPHEWMRHEDWQKANENVPR